MLARKKFSKREEFIGIVQWISSDAEIEDPYYHSLRLSVESFFVKEKIPTVQDHLYLWAFHGLMTYSDQVEIDFGHAGEVLNVIDGKTYDFDYRNLSEYPDKNVYKFYFVDEIEDGQVSIYYKKENLKVQMNFTTDINKYLGFWLTKGGLKGEYNFALEPASGYYDSLERAFKNNKFSKIASKEEKTWDLTLTFRKEND